mmetsp:Transcript_1893/g.6590  ORF Transcript_1893/g.6590 Transcript_1893/m.6590 type:complete len:168 (-) Transcript_1893:117-620(-)
MAAPGELDPVDFSDEEGDLLPPLPPPASGRATEGEVAAWEPCAPSLRRSDFEVAVPGASPLKGHVLLLDGQVYAWLGTAEATMGHLCAAAPGGVPTNPMPPVAQLVGGGADAEAAAVLARRVALKTGMHAVLSVNLPQDPLLQAACGKRLLQEVASLAAGGGAAPGE